MLADTWTTLRRHALLLFAALGVALLVGGAVLETVLERGFSGRFESVGETLWYALVTMTVPNYLDVLPTTPEGRLVGAVRWLGGVTALSVLTASVASALVAQRIKEARGLDTLTLKDHLIVCGWNAHAARVLDVLYASGSVRDVVLVNEMTEDAAAAVIAERRGRAVRFVRGDPASEPVLERANARHARAAIVVADASRAGATPSDDHTTRVTLTLNSMRPEMRVIVEALLPESEPHLRRAGADDVVVSGEFNAFLLSSAAVAPGLPQAVRPLLSISESALRRVAVPGDLVGRTYAEVAAALRARDGFQAIAVVQEDSGLTLDQLLSDDTSLVDEFIKEQFSEAGREFLRFEAGGTKVRLNPADGYRVAAKDAIIGIPGGT